MLELCFQNKIFSEEKPNQKINKKTRAAALFCCFHFANKSKSSSAWLSTDFGASIKQDMDVLFRQFLGIHHMR